MRLGIDATYLEEEFSGIKSFLLNFLFGLKKEKIPFKIFLFFQKKVVDLGKIDLSSFLKTLPKKKSFFSKLQKFIFFHFVLPKKLKKFQIDIFFSPNNFLPFLKGAKKEIIFLHDISWKINPSWKGTFFKIYATFFQKMSLKKADLILVPSKIVKSDLLKHYFFDGLERKIKVFYEGIDEIWTKIDRKEILRVKNKYNLPKSFLLFVGNLEPRKNLKTLILVFEKLKKEFPELNLVIVGKKIRISKTLWKKIKNDKKIHYFSNLPFSSLWAIYHLAQVFFLPTFYEGFGFPLLEAAKSNIPIVASSCLAIKEILPEHSFLKEPHNVGDFAQSIKEILKNPTFKKRIIEYQRKRLREFSSSKMAKSFLSFLDFL